MKLLKLSTLTCLLLFSAYSFAQPQLWGPTKEGGSTAAGTLFSLDNAGNSYNLEYDWTTPANGKRPFGALNQLSDEMLYGTTILDGANLSGVLYRYNYVTGVFENLHDFHPTTGILPEAAVIEASNGMVYGVTDAGGLTNDGVLFQYDIGTSAYSVVEDFEITTSGSGSHGRLLDATNNKIYGFTSHGGANGFGTIFEYDYGTTTFTTTADLDSTNTGKHPYGGFTQASNGLLYATIFNGGTNNNGVLIQYNSATNTPTKIHDFDAATTGSSPYGNLIEASNGKLYGMTFSGGANNQGTIFEFVTATNTVTKLIDFDIATIGAYPRGDLLESSNGKLYGYTTLGGSSNKGIVFEYDIALNSVTVKLDFTGPNGQFNANSFIEICAKPSIDIALTGLDTLCDNGFITLNATGTGSSYTWNNGITNNTSFNPVAGSDYYVVSSTNVCGTSTDSILIVSYPTYNTPESDSVCSGDSYTFPDGSTTMNITSTTVYVSNFQTINSCDSNYTTTIYVKPKYNISTIDTVCSGDSFTFPDGFVMNNITGATSHISNFMTVLGCDSIINSGVYVNPVYNITDNDEVCSGDDYTYPDGFIETNITAPTSHVSNLITYKGCDSIITTNIAVNQNYSQSDNAIVCSGDNYTFHDGYTEFNITTDLSHTSNLTSTKGCDSVIVTFVTAQSSYTYSEAIFVCPGISYSFPDGFVVNNVQNDLTHVSTITSATACDTIITTELFVHPEFSNTLIDTICKHDSYTFDDGTVMNDILVNTSYTSTYQTVNMCDSLIIENIQVTDLDTSVAITNSNVFTSNQGGAAYQWLDCDNSYAPIAGATGQQYTAPGNGSYALQLIMDGCTDTTACIVIAGIGFDDYLEATVEVYPNPTSSDVIVQFQQELNNVEVSLISLSGQVLFVESAGSASVIELNLSEYNNSVYLLRIKSGDHTIFKRITKL